MRPPFPVVCLLVSLSIGGAACASSDGRALPPPKVGQTSTSVRSPEVGQPSADPTVGFTLTSPAFVTGGVIPARHTCAGEDLSPALVWTSTPDAAELAVVVRDRDASGFVHWVLAGIDPAVLGIGEGGIPEGAVPGMNSHGTSGWFGPCPPMGSGTHTYTFVLYALPTAVTVDPTLLADDAARLIETSAAQRATLTGTVTATG